MRIDGNGGSQANYSPNTSAGPVADVRYTEFKADPEYGSRIAELLNLKTESRGSD